MSSTHKYYKKNVHLIMNDKYWREKIQLPTRLKNKQLKELKIKISAKHLSHSITIEYLNEDKETASVELYPYSNSMYIFQHKGQGLFKIIEPEKP